MDVTTSSLAAFLARVQIPLRAEVADVDIDRWRAERLDLQLLQNLHAAVVHDRESVRRVLADGASVLAPAQPGHVRTKPQAFRIGEHVERAWDQGKLKAGLVELLREVPTDPIRAAAQLVWGLSRAQPFTGMNERVALVLASWVLRGAGLPVLNVERIERDLQFARVLVAANADDRGALENYVVDAIWSEALELVEAVAPVPPSTTERWTLAHEHSVANEARANARSLSGDDVGAFIAEVTAWVERAGLASARTCEQLGTHAARVATAWNAMRRGILICPHEPIWTARWELAAGLQLVLVIGAAGRGMTGASSAHLGLELAGQVVPTSTPAILLVSDEKRDARHARTARWLERRFQEVIDQSPLRCLTARDVASQRVTP